MDMPAQVRISFNAREIEVSGREEFVLDRLAELSDLLDAFRIVGPGSTSPAVPPQKLVEAQSTTSEGHPSVPAEFGEFFHRFSDSLTDTDRMLVASYFVQEASEDRGFTTREANQVLLEQGYKLSNPSECNRRNLASKRVFAIAGGRKYRVSQLGIEHLSSLYRPSQS